MDTCLSDIMREGINNMDNDLKLNINISKDDIAKMAKQVIREIVEGQIQETMKTVDVTNVIQKKINKIDSTITQTINKTIKNEISNRLYNVNGIVREETRKVVLEEIQKKPLSGNVYLKIDNSDAYTDYD